MNRGERVFLHQLLGNKNRILEVVPAPRHKRHEHVASKSQFALIGARPIGNHIALLYCLSLAHDGLLIDARVLIRTLELRKLIDVGVDLARSCAARNSVLGPDDNSLGVDRVDHTIAARDYHGARILRRDLFHTRPHKRRFGAQQRDRLALHIRTHQRAVGVVVLEEWNQRSCDRHKLLRADVYEIQLGRL